MTVEAGGGVGGPGEHLVAHLLEVGGDGGIDAIAQAGLAEGTEGLAEEAGRLAHHQHQQHRRHHGFREAEAAITGRLRCRSVATDLGDWCGNGG